uniref:EF-hand domain-containing protein n=1 Tax=Lotharella oceanica TaxID=641309 RepID=A0A7S2TYK8_9EUKA|mmetsp:Transcript_33005/g.61364  ORF Transcript_33005/g.61364 Transcript_33005/m.61364 type:complete len:121 (+) Transcript_33005:63-425(+)|eukprot:CAMPEP_0170186362 /NCGR_PEP_ID=MMETSP0040_2-20121228/38917_1 /TAXON_ID=641309 /ORGANISM="Lotharella oceanica, Strain CCMP622" /LENGTH=120 /DNA_ID=CAMNT_0010433075 /DNA_START=44 /DNA_END=406 /DNA_ORIENTATION=+
MSADAPAGEKFNEALKVMGVTAEQFEAEVKKGFVAADADKSGSIEAKELAPIVENVMNAMMEIGTEFSKSEKESAVADVMKLVDQNKDGKLDVKEFGDAMKLGVLAIASALASKAEEKSA